MRRWIPFILLFGIAVASAVYFLLISQTSNYVPNTDDVSVIYREACAECHGFRGQGSGLIYPSLSDLSIDEGNIRNVIRNGAFFMPAFPNISDSILVRLSHYITQKSFRDEEEINSEN